MNVLSFLVLLVGFICLCACLLRYVLIRRKIKSYKIEVERELLRQENKTLTLAIIAICVAMSIPVCASVYFEDLMGSFIPLIMAMILIAFTVVVVMGKFRLISDESDVWNNKDY